MTARRYFGPELFRFFEELARNNKREWFLANKNRYERDVREPMLAFIADFAPRLRKISRSFVADPRPTGGSLIRIYRDVRFSPNKAPYKTHVSAHFTHHSQRDMHAPGFYIHLEPGGAFSAAGIWHPEGETLGKIRDAIVHNPARWKKCIAGRDFRQRLEFESESLTRPPKGYDPVHPLIADLKRKSFVASASYTTKDACSAGFIDRFGDDCEAAAPLMRFLTEAVGASW